MTKQAEWIEEGKKTKTKTLAGRFAGIRIERTSVWGHLVRKEKGEREKKKKERKRKR